jgi:hypothetical protein
MALARESIVAASESTDALEAEVRRRFCWVKAARKVGLESEADTNESSDEASSTSFTAFGG